MLTSALNFLTDKRKRLARSDTMPVFDAVAIGLTQPNLSSNGQNKTGSIEATHTMDGCLSNSLHNDDQVFTNADILIENLKSKMNRSIDLTGDYQSSSKEAKDNGSANNSFENKRQVENGTEHVDTQLSRKHSTGQMKAKSPKVSINDDSFISEKITNVTSTGQHRSRDMTKKKLQRSKSSAQIIRHRQTADKVRFEHGHKRSSSSQRNSSVEANREDGELIRRTQKRKSRRRVKTWMERGRRSRSVNAVQKIDYSGTKEQMESKNVRDRSLAKGTCDNYHKIRTLDYQTKSTLSTTIGATNDQSLQTPTSPQSLQNDEELHLAWQRASKLDDIGRESIKSTHQANAKRRLRRNNSTVNWPLDETHINSATIMTSSLSEAAGDLFLPTRKLEGTVSKQIQNSEQKLFNRIMQHVQRDDYTNLVSEFERTPTLLDDIKNIELSDCDMDGLSLLDVAMLSASPVLITYLMYLGFKPGSVVQSLITLGPSNVKICDPVRVHLLRRIGDCELEMLELQTELKKLIMKTNSLLTSENTAVDLCNENPQGCTLTFAQVAHTESRLFQCSERRERLIKFCHSLDRYPSNPPPPRRVKLMVSGPNAILVRISTASKYVAPGIANGNKVQDYVEFHTSDSSIDINDHVEHGRKASVMQFINIGEVIIRHRIEWSNFSDFPKRNTYSCVVDPVLNISVFNSNSAFNSMYKKHLFRTSFYELTDLKEGQPVYVRVYSISIRGWSDPCYAAPNGICPSSWYEIQKVGSDSVQKDPPLRYTGNSLLHEFKIIKQTLDQQILLWIHSLTNSGADGAVAQVIATEDSVRKTRSPLLQRKRSFRFPFASKGFKFLKQFKCGIYMALAIHEVRNHVDENGANQSEKHLVTIDDYLPVVCVSNEDIRSIPSFNSDFSWFAKLICDSTYGSDLQLISEHLMKLNPPGNIQFRFRLLEAFVRLQSVTGLFDLGYLYPEPIRCRIISKDTVASNAPMDQLEKSMLADESTIPNASPMGNIGMSNANEQSATILLLSKYVKNSENFSLTSGLKWNSLSKVLKLNKLSTESAPNFTNEDELSRKSSINENEQVSKSISILSSKSEANQTTPENVLLTKLEAILAKSEGRTRKLSPGLYVAFVQMQARMDQQATVLISNTNECPYMFPLEKVRRRHHVSQSEWNALCLSVSQSVNETIGTNFKPDHKDRIFCTRLFEAAERLAIRLGFEDVYIDQLRLYLPEIVRISPNHSFIILCPPVEEVCLPPSSTSSTPLNCSWCFMQFVERNIGLTYDTYFYSQTCSLTSILELLLSISNFVQRQCLGNEEYAQCAERTLALQSLQSQLEVLYSGKRWLSDVLSCARDKKRCTTNSVTISQLRFYVDEHLTNMNQLKKNFIKLFHQKQKSMIFGRRIDKNEIDKADSYNFVEIDNKECFILIHVDFRCGLPRGTCVKILVKSHTKADEIVALTLRKISETVAKEFDETLALNAHEYALTLSNGGKTHFLKGTTRVMQLKAPWKFGRYGVRNVVHNEKNINPPDSPIRVYLATAHEEYTDVTENHQGQIYHSVESVKPRFFEVPSVMCKANLVSSPIVHFKESEQ